MNKRTDKTELLADVFGETSSADFRGAMLGETLRRVRRRRRWQQTRRVIVLVLGLGVLAFLVLQYESKPVATIAVKPAVKPVPANYQLVRTEPLPARAMVTTQPLAVAQIITSTAVGNLVMTTRGNYRVLNDDQLLALVAHRSAALIRVNGETERLVFADPADEKGFPVP